jgi:hypothetical protein
MTDITASMEIQFYRKSPMAILKLAFYVNFFHTAASPQKGLLQDEKFFLV